MKTLYIFLTLFLLIGCGKKNDDKATTPFEGSWTEVNRVCSGVATPVAKLQKEVIYINAANQFSRTRVYSDCSSITTGVIEVVGSKLRFRYYDNTFTGACPGYTFTSTYRDHDYSLSGNSMELVYDTCTESYSR